MTLKYNLQDKEDVASLKQYGWSEGFSEGVIYGIKYAEWLRDPIGECPEPPKEPLALADNTASM